MHPTRSRLRRLASVGVAVLAGLGLVAIAPSAPAGAASGSATGAQGQRLTVSQVDGLNPAGTTVTVTGTGFAIPGFDIATDGMYLALCVDTGPTSAPSPCLGTVDMTGGSSGQRWVTNNPLGTASAVSINADGSFTATLTIDADDGSTNCFTTTLGSCKVVTRMDHRASGDRSQDVKVPVRFTGQPHTSTEAFVAAAHADFLGRAATPAELDRDARALGGGTSKAAYLRTLSTSDAWLAGVVNELYQDTLGRPGDAGGVAFWTGRLRNGWSVARVAASFYASPEYYDGIGGGTDGTWIDDLYEKVLQRPADADGRAYWVSQVRAKGRGNVAQRLYQSNESARTRVRGLYATLLGRAPDADGLTYWAGQVVTKGDLALAVNLANSTEYANRADTRFP